MPRGPKGEKRPADVIGAAVMVGRIATGEIDESTPPDDGKDPAAVSLGRKGGAARAAGMTAKRRKEIAKNAAAKRWGTKVK
jgi:hypothetical protein